MATTGLKVYEVEVKGDPRWNAVYSAESPGKARYARLLDLRDAGWEIGFKDLVVRRVPSMDQCSDTLRTGMSPEYARRLVAETQAVSEWNRNYAIGTPVVVKLDSGEYRQTHTRSAAQLLSDHAAIWLEGICGAYHLDRVAPR